MASLNNRFSEADQLFMNAMALLTSGEIVRAAAILVQITERFDHFGKAWFELGNIQKDHLEDYESAAECYLKAIELNPTYWRTYIAYADVLFILERYAEMNAILNQAAEIKGVRKDLVFSKSALLMESQQRFDEAIDTYKKALLATYSDEEIERCEKAIHRCITKKKYF
jgi:tetratricopeptide (TPR) repeat protein